jgi:hypothetical protein
MKTEKKWKDKTWEEAKLQPAVCRRCGGVRHCAKLTQDDPDALGDLVAYLCQRCFNAKISDVLSPVSREQVNPRAT